MAAPYNVKNEVLDLKLPWPHRKLSPNARIHWAVLSKAKNTYRHACYLEAKLQIIARPSLAKKLNLTLIFVPPDRRHYDRDNLVARIKSGLDGLCDYLQIDDKCIHSVTASVAEDVDKKNPHVRFILSAINAQEHP